MILITGINGFISQHLYNSLKETNEIFGTTKEDSANISQILQEKTPKIIFHVGAEIYDQDKMFESNVILTYKILEYCKTAANLQKLVIIGSSSEYGRKTKPMSEDDSLEPETIYEGTKSACTMLARSYAHTYKIPILIIRPFTIYGPLEKPNKFLQILFTKMKNKERNISVSEGVHDYVYIDDFINAIIKITYENKERFDIVNIGSGIQTSNQEVVETFQKVTGYKFERYYKKESKSYDSTNWVCDTNKLNQYYKTKISLEEGIHLINKMI
jgi:nucleoside-diphosphate-sugar epimerase